MWQRDAPHPGAEGAELSECDGETGDMADDRDGLTRMVAGDRPEHCRHAGDDLMPRLAIGRALSEFFGVRRPASSGTTEPR